MTGNREMILWTVGQKVRCVLESLLLLCKFSGFGNLECSEDNQPRDVQQSAFISLYMYNG